MGKNLEKVAAYSPEITGNQEFASLLYKLQKSAKSGYKVAKALF